MAYNVEESIDRFGKEKLLSLVLTDGLTQIQIHKVLNLSNSDKRMHSSIYKRIYNYLGISDIPYKTDNSEIRKFKLEFDRVRGNYWESEYIVDYLITKLQNPIVNFAGSAKRFVISFPKHPKANPDSNQVKAHIVAWELVHEQYVPENHWVIAIDGNYTNLDITNLALVNCTEHRHNMFCGVNNPSYKHGLAARPKQGGWQTIAKKHLRNSGVCKICGSVEDLVVHHIINYHLFSGYVEANNTVNLLTLCRSCHTKLHNNNTNIKAHIEETQYSKLLELLETLKSQVPDPLIEIYRGVEKQLGLTDNQQPSTV